MKKIQKIIIGIGVLALTLSLTSSLALAVKGTVSIGGACVPGSDNPAKICVIGAFCEINKCIANGTIQIGQTCDKTKADAITSDANLRCVPGAFCNNQGIEAPDPVVPGEGEEVPDPVVPGVCQFTTQGVDCASTAEGSADALICKVLGTLSIIFSLVLVLAVLYFVWGVVQYVTAGGDEEKAGAAKKTMMYGIIALVVIVAVAGILAIATNYLDITNAIKLPFIGG